MKQKNSPQKKFQEEMTAKELIKTNVNNITDQEFIVVIIRLIALLETSIEDSRESIAAEIKELKHSHDEFTNVVNEVQNKLEVVTVRIEEAEGRISEIEDKIMEKMKLRKKEIRKNSRP